MIDVHARSIQFAVFALVLLAGCSGKENPVAAPVSWRIPGVGSTFTYLAFRSLDSSGGTLPDPATGGATTSTNGVLESGSHIEWIRTGTATYAGSETIDVGGTALLTHRIDLDMLAQRSGSSPAESRSRVAYRVAPSIGFFVRKVAMPVDDPAGATSLVMSLTGYSLK